MEQIGDIKGKAASLGNLANIHMQQQQWDRAESLLLEALKLTKQIGEPPAFEIVKLGQVAQARGDHETARSRYGEGLAIFERLGMPEANQVRQMIASLESDDQPAAPADPLRQLIARARAAAQSGDVQDAIAAQEQAVALLRQAVEQSPENRDGLVTLSVLRFNLAGYYQQAGRHDDAVAAFEEVVALDERTGHPDLAADREALARARHLARVSPEERAALDRARPAPSAPAPDPDQLIAALEQQAAAQLAQLPPEERAQMEAGMRQFARQWAQMSDEERAQQVAAMQAAGQRQQIDDLARQARDGAIAALRGETDREPLVAKLEQAAAQAAEGEEPGAPWAELSAYLRALVALLRGDPLPPVPPRFAAHLAAVQDAQ